VRRRVVLLVLTFLAVGIAATACGSGGSESAPSEPAGSTSAGTDKAWLETLRADWSSYSGGLTQVSANCPVPKVTLDTMHECKLRMLALIKIDKAVIDDLANLDVPPKVQPAIGALSASLAALNDAFRPIIRDIDRQDIAAFKSGGGTGSPIDNAINGNNDAIYEVDRLEPDAHLVGTIFIPPS
jgi:hypothetical protein